MTNRRGLAPGMFEFCCGPQTHKQLHIHINRLAIDQVPTQKARLRDWTIGRFAEKDRYRVEYPFISKTRSGSRIIEEFYSEEVLNGNLLPCVPLSQTLPSTLFFSVALVAPFFSPTISRIYLLTIASAPLLIAWLHIRHCV